MNHQLMLQLRFTSFLLGSFVQTWRKVQIALERKERNQKMVMEILIMNQNQMVLKMVPIMEKIKEKATETQEVQCQE